MFHLSVDICGILCSVFNWLVVYGIVVVVVMVGVWVRIGCVCWVYWCVEIGERVL